MSIKKPILTLAFVLGTAFAGLALAVDGAYVPYTPERDLEDIRAFFVNKLPGVPLSEYVDGTYALDESAREQWQQAEDFPPYELDIDRGKTLFETPFANGRSYSSCFKLPVDDIRTSYPYFAAGGGNVRTLPLDLNGCRARNGEVLLDYNSTEMVSLEAYLSSRARGKTSRVNINGDDAIEWYTQGKRMFFMKRGRLNLSCADCHIYNVGGSLAGQILSPAIGQTTHFPAWRSGWQESGSLHRRYAECMTQIGAEPPDPQSAEFRALEFFHSFLSNDLKLNGPGFRK